MNSIPLDKIQNSFSELFFAVNFLALIHIYKRAIQQYGLAIALLLFISMIRFHYDDFLNSQANHILLWLLMNFLWDRHEKHWHSATCIVVLCTFEVTVLINRFEHLNAGVFNLLVSLLMIVSAICASIRYKKGLKNYPSRMILVENALISGFIVSTVIVSHQYLLLFPAILSLVLFSQTWAFGLQLLFLTLIPFFLENLVPEFAHESYILICGALMVFVSIIQIPWFNFRQKVQIWLFSKHKDLEFLTLQTNARRGNFWQPITGSVELGESSAEAAIREVREETSFNVENSLNSAESEFVFKRPPNYFYEFAFYSEIEPSKQSEVKIDPNEHSQFKWLTFSKAHSMTKFESNKNILEKIFLLIQTH